ncbi:MAG: MFS transporter [bacterium]
MAGEEASLKRALRYRWLIFWILAFGYILVYFHRLCPAVVAVDMMRDLQTSGELLGLLASAYFYPYAVMQMPAGLLSDSWGPRKTITVFFCVAFAGSIILGLSPSVGMAVVGRALVGLGVSMLFVPTLKILAEWFLVREFATMTGILMAMGGIGSLTAATPLALLSGWLGWRLSFGFVGGLTLLLAVLVWFLVRDRPSEFGWSSPTEAERIESGAPPIGLLEGVKKVLSHPPFWPVAAWFFFDCGVFFSFGGLWGGPYLAHVYGLSRDQAGHILSMMAIGMIIGSPLLSHVSDKLLRGRKPVLVLCSLALVGLTAALAFFTGTIPLWGLYGLCLGLGIFSSAIVVIAFTTAKELFPVQMAGTSTGLVNLFPFAGGAVFQPVLGHILEKHGRVSGAFQMAGYQEAFLVLFGCSLAALAASLLMKETLRRTSSGG